MNRLRRWLAPPVVYDLAAFAGLALMAGGLWWIFPPAALIVTGAAFIATSILGARTWTSDNAKRSLKRRKDSDLTS